MKHRFTKADLQRLCTVKDLTRVVGQNPTSKTAIATLSILEERTAILTYGEGINIRQFRVPKNRIVFID